MSKFSRSIPALVALFVLAPATPALAEDPSSVRLPDHCAELDAYGHPAHCEPAKAGDAPWWDGEVCCKADDCHEPGASGCGDYESVYCQFAELEADGSMTCLYEVPEVCDVYECPPGGGGGEPEAMCCYENLDQCEVLQGWCAGDVLWCDAPYTNEDGSVGCADAA